MRFRSSIMSLLLLLTIAAKAENLTEIFRQIPDSILPYLSPNNRLDFLDFMASHMKAEVRNLLGGTSEMTALTDDSLSIRMSEALRIDILLLTPVAPVDSSRQVVCVVSTYGTDSLGLESRTDYYTTRWTPLTTSPRLSPADERRVKALEVQTILKRDEEILKKN
jgi:hypothetical protein